MTDQGRLEFGVYKCIEFIESGKKIYQYSSAAKLVNYSVNSIYRAIVSLDLGYLKFHSGALNLFTTFISGLNPEEMPVFDELLVGLSIIRHEYTRITCAY